MKEHDPIPGIRSWRDLSMLAVGVYGGSAMAVLVVHADRLYGWIALAFFVVALAVLLVKDVRGSWR